MAVPQRTASTDTGSIRANSLWMMGEQILRQAVALGFSIWIARQYGPAGMGSLSFALSLCALVGVIASLGLTRIAVREMASDDPLCTPQEVLRVTVSLRLLAGLAAMALAIGVAALIDRSTVLIVAILAAGYLATSFDTIDLYFQSQLQSRIVARFRVLALVVSSGVKTYLLASESELWVISVAILFDWLCAAVALHVALWRSGDTLRIGLGNGALARRLLTESVPEVMAGFCALAFMRIDQLMLQVMHGPAEVGLMAVSSRLTEAWYLVPAAIVSSTYPVIVKLSQTDVEAAERRQRSLYRAVVALSVCAALAVTLLAGDIVRLIYGPDFERAADVLVIQAWCGIFMSFGIASGTWLIAQRMGRFNLYRTSTGAALNVALNLLFIPTYGAVGAAWATLASFAFAYFAFDFVVPQMRTVGRQKLRAMVDW